MPKLNESENTKLLILGVEGLHEKIQSSDDYHSIIMSSGTRYGKTTISNIMARAGAAIYLAKALKLAVHSLENICDRGCDLFGSCQACEALDCLRAIEKTATEAIGS